MTDWNSFFEKVGAVWHYAEGGPHARHRLTEHHSGYYFNSDVIVKCPEALAEVIERGFAPRVRSENYDLIVSPLTSITAAFSLGDALARHLGVPASAYDIEARAFSRPIHAGLRALVVTDDIHGGHSAKALAAALLQRGVAVVPRLLTLFNFSEQDEIAGTTIDALATITFPKWRPVECPLCRRGSPVVDARSRWDDLNSVIL